MRLHINFVNVSLWATFGDPAECCMKPKYCWIVLSKIIWLIWNFFRMSIPNIHGRMQLWIKISLHFQQSQVSDAITTITMMVCTSLVSIWQRKILIRRDAIARGKTPKTEHNHRFHVTNDMMTLECAYDHMYWQFVCFVPRWRCKTLARRDAIARGRTPNLSTTTGFE